MIILPIKLNNIFSHVNSFKYQQNFLKVKMHNKLTTQTK